MKFKSIVFCLILIFSNNLNSQNKFQGKVIYKASMEKPNFSKTENDSTKSIEVKEMVALMLKNMKDVELILHFTSSESLFEPIAEMKSESNKTINLTATLAGKGKFYTNTTNKEILYQRDFMGDLFLIQYMPKQWKLTQEIKQIGAYVCYKATTIKTIESPKGMYERIITAWYTPQISVNFGPQEFNGLPGIILELDYGKIIYSAIKIELNPTEQIIIKKPIKGKKKTEKEYNEIVKEAASALFENKID